MILVIDGNNLASICHYVCKKFKVQVVNKEGLNVTAVDEFMRRIYSLYDNLYPDSILICWDKKLTGGIANFRKDEGDYKANRTKDNTELYAQCDIMEALCKNIGIKNMHPNIMEADDLIAWLSHELKASEKVVIASVDGDLLQLVDYNVDYFNLRTKKTIDILNFNEIVGIRRTRYLLYKMILGDTADNIKGLVGFGPVKSKLLAESEEPFKGLSQDNLKLLVRNKKLMDLRVGYTVYPEEVETYKKQLYSPNYYDFNQFMELSDYNNIRSIGRDRWKWEAVKLNT